MIREPIRFTRGRHSYLITRSYTAEPGYVGICDGRVIARAADAARVAQALIQQQAKVS